MIKRWKRVKGSHQWYQALLQQWKERKLIFPSFKFWKILVLWSIKYPEIPECVPPPLLISLVHNNRFLHWSGIFNPDIGICNVNNMVDLKISGTFQHHFWSHHRSHRLFLHFHHWRICSFGILNFTFVLWNLWLEYHQINVFERFFIKQYS